MTEGETLFLGTVVVAFIIFALVLAYVSYRSP